MKYMTEEVIFVDSSVFIAFFIDGIDVLKNSEDIDLSHP